MGGVRGEALRRGRDHRRLGLVRDHRQVERLGVALELLELGGAFEGHEAPRGRRVVGHEGGVLVLPKVHGRVVARGRPHDDGEDFDERLRGVEHRPPGRVLLVEMSHRADLGPPVLELLIAADGLVTCKWECKVCECYMVRRFSCSPASTEPQNYTANLSCIGESTTKQQRKSD